MSSWWAKETSSIHRWPIGSKSHYRRGDGSSSLYIRVERPSSGHSGVLRPGRLHIRAKVSEKTLQPSWNCFFNFNHNWVLWIAPKKYFPHVSKRHTSKIDNFKNLHWISDFKFNFNIRIIFICLEPTAIMKYNYKCQYGACVSGSIFQTLATKKGYW